MTYFNSNPLPEGVKLITWQADSPDITPRTLNIADRRGDIRTGRKTAGRHITLTVAIWADTVSESIAILDALNAWCYSDSPAPLIPDCVSGRYLLAECTGYAAPDMNEAYAEFDIEFAAACPDWIDSEESHSSASTFTIGGGVSTPIRMEVTLSADTANPVWIIDGHTIAFGGTVPAGTLVVDTDKGRATLNGDNITGMVTIASDIEFRLAPGAHTVIGMPAPAIWWRNRRL